MTDYATTTPAPEPEDLPTVAPVPEPEPEAEKINLTELSETLNGFDQVAIRQRFHERFDQLAEDPLMFARALYFVHLRRENVRAGLGHRDQEAFQASMDMPTKDLNDLFDGGPEADEFEGDESALSERDTQYADFVIGTGLSMSVDQYQELTIQQRSKIIESANRR